jgi:hypothetical protein
MLLRDSPALEESRRLCAEERTYSCDMRERDETTEPLDQHKDTSPVLLDDLHATNKSIQ